MPVAGKSSSPVRRGTSTTRKTGRSTSGRATVAATSSRAPKKATGVAKRPAVPAKPTAEAGSETSSSGRVAGAVQRDLDLIAERDPALAKSGLAALALAMAEEIDDPNSATSKPMCAAQLREALDRLRALMPDAEIVDGVDDLARRRAARLDRKSGT